MNGYEGYPRIQLLRQSHQVFGLGEKGLYQYSEESDQDGKLYDQWPQAPNRTYAGLPVKAHGFLGNAGPVPAVALLDFPHSGLQFAHSPHLANLLQGQWQGHQTHQNGKCDDGQPHVAETDNVQHHQGVEHGPNYYFVPKCEEYGEVQGDS